MIQAENTLTGNVIDASRIRALDHDEAAVLARQELDRFLKVVESLSGDDWEQPTDCAEWTVRDILAHQAGSYAGGASMVEFIHQASAKPAPGKMKVDAMNATQLADRAGSNPAELIAELRRVGPKAIQARNKLPRLPRKLKVPMGPPLGTVPIEYLTDLIYPRDTWMHRADICRATGKSFEQTVDHDGRLVALVVRDLVQTLDNHLGGQSVIFDLSGVAGGCYRIGKTSEPSAILKLDVLEFNRLASGRITAQAAKVQSLISISGDYLFADEMLSRTSVAY